MRIKNVISWVVSLAMIGAGLALIAVFFLGQGSQSTATNENDPGGFNVPEVGGSGEKQSAGGPEDKTLKLTVPAMSRIEDDTIPDAVGTNEQALRNNAGLHLKGTGFPWQEGSNTYIAGHRLGYPSTDSFLAFYDQQKLERGDEIFVTDSQGTRYTYRVFKNFVVSPTELSVTKPVEGKRVLTLQTCTLPDYSKRLITQAELVNVERA